MNFDHLQPEITQFQSEFPEYDVLFITNDAGELLYTSDESYVTQEDCQGLMHAWKNHESAFSIGENRYPILSWEIFQFAARNVKGKGAIIATQTTSNLYICAHLDPKARNPPAIATIQLNRTFWKLV